MTLVEVVEKENTLFYVRSMMSWHRAKFSSRFYKQVVKESRIKDGTSASLNDFNFYFLDRKKINNKYTDYQNNYQFHKHIEIQINY